MARRCFCAISLCDFLVLFVLPRAAKREYYANKSWRFIFFFGLISIIYTYYNSFVFFSLSFCFLLFVFPLPSPCFTVVQRYVLKKTSKNSKERRNSEYKRLGDKQHCCLYKHWDTRPPKSRLSFLAAR